MSVEENTNFTLVYDEKLKKSRWLGYPDPRYILEGNMLKRETTYVDDDGEEQVAVSYRKPIEIIADFKFGTEVLRACPEVRRAVPRKFGGGLKGFVWVDNVSGGGEVVLPFTAPHIFIATGDKAYPILAEIFADLKADNHYEVIDGKTHVYVKSFSGIGGAAGASSTLIAHYKMNEDTASDNDEKVVNGDFANWTGDNPNSWSLTDTETGTLIISESAGKCRLQSGINEDIGITQGFLTVGKKYSLSIDVTDDSGGTIYVRFGNEVVATINSTGTDLTYTGVATGITFKISTANALATDMTIDNVSVKLCAVEDSSGNDHDGLAQQDTDAIHATGKINGAFDFDGSVDFIEIADDDDFSPAGTPFSISVDVYMHDATSFVIASKGVEATDGEWMFYTDGSDKLIMHFYDESINKYIGRKYNTALTAYQNTWVRLSMTYDGGALCASIKLYLNDIQVDDTDDESATFVAVENLTGVIKIGTDGTNFANGLMENLTFFGVELSVDDVKRINNNRMSTEIMSEVDPARHPRRGCSPTGLRANWEY